MRVGLISDIHGPLPREAHRALTGCDHIICAGDCEMPATIMELETIAPTTAVRGNCDTFHDPTIAPFTAGPLLEGVRFFVVHRPQDIGTVPDDVDVVVHGHTHVRRTELIEGVWYINPGSASRPRDGKPPCVAIVELEGAAVRTVSRIDVG